VKELIIFVHAIAGLLGPGPVTGGVPIAEGTAPPGVVFSLADEQGSPVPLQTTVLAQWKDGSARWVLLDFQSTPSDKARQQYSLAWGPSEAVPAPPAAVTQRTGERPEIESGDVSVAGAEGALLSISERVDVLLSLTDGEGQVCPAVVESTDVDTDGPMRSTLALKGSFRTPDGARVFQFRMRASVYAGLSRVRLEPLILVDADAGVLQRIRDLKLVIRPRGAVRSAHLAGEPGWTGQPESEVRLFQFDDEQYRIEGADGTGGKAPGWASIDDGKGLVAVALRDFWQQWPKSIETSPDGLSVGLFPRFNEGDFAHMQPWYKHQYLFDGDCYQLRTGQARRWDIWLDMAGDGPVLAQTANAPRVPVADPAQAIGTGVWGAIAPAGIPEMAEYDPWAENLFAAYCESIESQRDYGAMNWGDWFGERKVNWGNHEYDTAQQLLMQFARTGDPEYFYVADAAARHSSEVDVIHYVNDDLAELFGVYPGYPARAGMVHQHTVGHVSGFYGNDIIAKLFQDEGVDKRPKPYTCTTPYNLGHIWTQGMARHYFLTGDPFLRETVALIGDNLARLVEDREFKFMGHSHCGRVTGWTMLALSGAYEMDLDERYVNAMKVLADDALAEQDPVCGGWLYSLPAGHCNCEKAKHVGMAGFITSVLINGLSRYAELSGDERIPDAVNRAVTFLDNDTWREEWQDWRYTSCPASSRMNQFGVTMMAHVNAVRLAGNPEHRRVLQVAWDAKFKRLLEAPSSVGQGKTYTATMLGCPETIGVLAQTSEGSSGS
jgi:PcRGLX-like N-terminal RIFT barrel domain/PcRGLX-like protein C-terminal alpha/alpha toroid domain